METEMVNESSEITLLQCQCRDIFILYVACVCAERDAAQNGYPQIPSSFTRKQPCRRLLLLKRSQAGQPLWDAACLRSLCIQFL